MVGRPAPKTVFLATLLGVAAFTAGVAVAGVAPVVLTQYGSLFGVSPQPVPDLSVSHPSIQLVPFPVPAPASLDPTAPTNVSDGLQLGLNPLTAGAVAETVVVTFGAHAMHSTEFQFIVAVNTTSQDGNVVVVTMYLATPATLPGALAVTLFYQVAPVGDEFELNGMTVFIQPCAALGDCP